MQTQPGKRSFKILLKINSIKVFNSVVKQIAVGAEGLWFSSGDGQIEHSVANGSPPASQFFGTVSPRPLVA